jgi:heterotetrameric sarcosine oxidase gamma subunit
MKLSPIHRQHLRAGAIFAGLDSWQIPEVFTTAESEVAAVRQAVGIADLSHRAKFDTSVQTQSDAWQLGPRHYLLIADPPCVAPPGAVDVTGAYVDFLLAGPLTKALLGKLSPLNTQEEAFPNFTCAQASVAHSHAVLLREDIKSLPAVHLLIGREYAESAWEAILHAGHEFHIAPVGLEALARLKA